MYWAEVARGMLFAACVFTVNIHDCRKTTAILHKMLWIERSFQINSGGTINARQMFVTQSGVLAEKVQEYFNKMLESLGMSSKSAQELKAIAEERKRRLINEELVDKDEDYDLNTALPARFSDLRDEHFPLFITFDHVHYFSRTTVLFC